MNGIIYEKRFLARLGSPFSCKHTWHSTPADTNSAGNRTSQQKGKFKLLSFTLHLKSITAISATEQGKTAYHFYCSIPSIHSHCKQIEYSFPFCVYIHRRRFQSFRSFGRFWPVPVHPGYDATVPCHACSHSHSALGLRHVCCELNKKNIGKRVYYAYKHSHTHIVPLRCFVTRFRYHSWPAPIKNNK